jgi:hypothetical protein
MEGNWDGDETETARDATIPNRLEYPACQKTSKFAADSARKPLMSQ